MHATLGRSRQPAGLAQVLQPAKALLLLHGNPGGIDLALERIGAFEALARPKLDGAQAQGQAIEGERQTGMHQQTSHGQMPGLACFAAARAQARTREQTHAFEALALIGEFGRVMQDQNGSAGRLQASASRLEVSA
jgi:hypothetical protein